MDAKTRPIMKPAVREQQPLFDRILPRPLRRSPLAMGSLIVVALWVFLAAAAPIIAPYAPLKQDIVNRLAEPSTIHLLGTDVLGRDILSRILHGARISIPVGIAAVIFACILGILIGSIAGFLGGIVDELTMRLTDLMLSFPTVILALVITAALGAGIQNAIIAIMIAWWPSYARLVRGLVLSVKERDYVMAARGLGASQVRALVRHVLPNTISPIVIMSTLDMGYAILTFASLSFLGLGPPPQIPEWGSMIAAGRNNFDQWWISTFPGAGDPQPHAGFQYRGRQSEGPARPALPQGDLDKET